MESPSGGSLFVSRLATNVDVKPGSLSIVVPQVRTGKYFVMGESLESIDLLEWVIFTLLCYSWQIRAQQCTLLYQCVVSCGGNPTRTFIGRTLFIIVPMVPLTYILVNNLEEFFTSTILADLHLNLNACLVRMLT